MMSGMVAMVKSHLVGGKGGTVVEAGWSVVPGWGANSGAIVPHLIGYGATVAAPAAAAAAAAAGGRCCTGLQLLDRPWR